MAWTVGQRINKGTYTIQKMLGEGGFAIAYLVKDASGRPFVVKTLNESVQKRTDFEAFQEDFVNEALRIRGCQHPHIVKVYGIFQEQVSHPTQSGLFLNLWCITMEYIDGETLAERLKNRGILPEPEALKYVQQIGQALMVVHGQGMLHRDVKPQNIMVRRGSQEAVLIDFGIARDFKPNQTQTHTQFLSGGYTPIEQYDRRAKRGEFSDVYALAATLYSLVTGQMPPESQMRAYSLLKHHADLLEPPQTLNPRLGDRTNDAIMRGMATDPQFRPQTVADWFALLNLPVNETGTFSALKTVPVMPPLHPQGHPRHQAKQRNQLFWWSHPHSLKRHLHAHLVSCCLL